METQFDDKQEKPGLMSTIMDLLLPGADKKGPKKGGDDGILLVPRQTATVELDGHVFQTRIVKLEEPSANSKAMLQAALKVEHIARDTKKDEPKRDAEANTA